MEELEITFAVSLMVDSVQVVEDVPSVVTPGSGPDGIRLTSLPVQLREILAPFDKVNAQGVRDGIIDLNELATFSKEFKEFQSGCMPISVFSPEHQEKLRAFDADGGGKLDADVRLPAPTFLSPAELSSSGCTTAAPVPIALGMHLTGIICRRSSRRSLRSKRRLPLVSFRALLLHHCMLPVF